MKQLILSLLILVSGNVYSEKLSSKFQDVTVNIEFLKPGGHLAVLWERTTVWIIKRTDENIKDIENTDLSKLGAPHGEDWISQFIKAYDTNPILPNLLELDQLTLEKETYRSYKKDISVVLGFSPYSGCVLSYKPKKLNGIQYGYIDPCKEITFDHAGRVYKNNKVERYWNLYIPPHKFIDDKTIVIGLGSRNISNTNYEPNINYDALKPNEKLVESAKRGKINIVKEALASGISSNTYIDHGITPLLVAASKGNNEIINLLIDNGANINQSNNYGFTPIHSAISGFRLSTIELLAKAGANINQIGLAPSCNGTPLNFAITWANTEQDAAKIVKILLKYGANPSISHNEKNAFHWAKENGYTSILLMLEKAKSI